MRREDVVEIDGRKVTWIESDQLPPLSVKEQGSMFFGSMYGGDLSAFIRHVQEVTKNVPGLA